MCCRSAVRAARRSRGCATSAGAITADLLAIPGIATVEQQIGRAEAAEDTFPPNVSEMHVELEAGQRRGRGGHSSARSAMSSTPTPALQTEALTFLGDRIGESLSGETAALVISAYGPDLDALDRVAANIAAVVRSVPGSSTCKCKRRPARRVWPSGSTRRALARRGVSLNDAYDAIEAAYQGRSIAQVTDGQRITDVALRAAVVLRGRSRSRGRDHRARHGRRVDRRCRASRRCR